MDALHIYAIRWYNGWVLTCKNMDKKTEEFRLWVGKHNIVHQGIVPRNIQNISHA